jgi:hypothetical protein
MRPYEKPMNSRVFTLSAQPAKIIRLICPLNSIVLLFVVSVHEKETFYCAILCVYPFMFMCFPCMGLGVYYKRDRKHRSR